MAETFIPQRPVVVAYPKMPEAFVESEAMAAYLKEKGLDAPHGSLYDESLRRRGPWTALARVVEALSALLSGS